MVPITEETLWEQVMEKGRSLERRPTNGLEGAEIAGIMERFKWAPFQIQIYRDLAIARYKLYDAEGIWLQSRRHVSQDTYGQIESVARGYLDETLVVDYFRRLKADPFGRVPPLNIKRANYATSNFVNLPMDEQLEAAAEFHRSSLRKEDWFYSLRGGKIFAAENETSGYTLMLAEDY